jgi:hypothetical protein
LSLGLRYSTPRNDHIQRFYVGFRKSRPAKAWLSPAFPAGPPVAILRQAIPMNRRIQ